MNDTAIITALSNGVNQKGVRNHNERLILSVLQRHGEMPGSDIARRTRLSAQTVSVILRKLETDGLVKKGKPLKGKIGKPSIPMALNPNGVLSIGCKLGRRSSELFLMNLSGEVLFEKRMQYDVAIPDMVFRFIRQGFQDAAKTLGAAGLKKLCGIGVALPFEIWKWGASDSNSIEEFLSWKDVDFEREIAKFTDLPVFMVNDATSACWAEHAYGRGKEFRDYAYFFVSTFIGGGIVINQSVYEGNRGNAGALGSIRVGDDQGRTRQLIDVASIHLLETRLQNAGLDPRILWQQPQDWSEIERYVTDWIDATAIEIAQACLSTCAVIDFEAIVIDGAFPGDVRQRLVASIREKLPIEDSRGLILPRIEEGVIGAEARAIGAASGPIFAQFFLNTNSRLFDT
ncbi:ROK family transcriptional regulator [Arenibacterium sp. CAU 1754]